MLRYFLIFFILIFNLQAQEVVKEKPIEIVVGIDKIYKLDFPPSPSVQIGNSALLNYQLIPQKREITFKGINSGKTSVIIRNLVGDIKARFLVNITANDQSKAVRELKELLGDVEGLEIGLKGEHVYVGGYIIVPQDIGRVVIILEKYPNVLRLVEVSPHTQRAIANRMQTEIQKNNLKAVTVRLINNSFWLEGVVSSNAAKAKAQQIASAFIPDYLENLARRTRSVKAAQRPVIQNFITVNKKNKPEPIPKLIKITAQFVELTRDYNRIFGFKWQPLLSEGQGAISFGRTSSGGVDVKSNNAFSGTIANLLPKLASAKAAGYARVIQSGVIIMKNKVKGMINKTEKKPFAVGTGEFTKAETAEAGFNLEITPKILKEESIDLSIGLSVSATAGDPPQIFANSVSTSLVVKSKESAAVGGIVVHKSSTDFDRHPPGGETEASEGSSPLFSFIRSKSYTSTKSQFVVFVTPEIIESATKGTDLIRRKFRRRVR